MSDLSENQSQTSENPSQALDWRRLLTAEERAAMLRDIASVSLAAGTTLFPEQPWSGLDVTAGTSAAPKSPPKSPVELLGFIEYLLPHLAQALHQITHSPLTSAAACVRPTRPERARRVTTAAWMTHARQFTQQVNEMVTLLSHDTPENRAVKSFLDVLRRDCRAIALMAEAEEEAEVLSRALHCARRLGQLACKDWWEEVSTKPGEWTLPPTQRGSLRPDYACIAREQSRYRRSFGFDWNHPLLTLPPRETWRLYETWCLLTVFQTLRELGWNPISAQEVFSVREGRLILTLATGTASQITLQSAQGQTLRLAYNQAFTEGRESLTHTMQPDITLSDGEQVWILDAKFKAYAEPGEEGEDINQMHAYRDAIIGSRGRSVARAWCLYAGQAHAPIYAPNRARITYGRGPETPVGAICLRPGAAETLSSLREMLRHWLASAR